MRTAPGTEERCLALQVPVEGERARDDLIDEGSSLDVVVATSVLRVLRKQRYVMLLADGDVRDTTNSDIKSESVTALRRAGRKIEAYGVHSGPSALQALRIASTSNESAFANSPVNEDHCQLLVSEAG